jgi:hypothetical protein
MDNPQPTFLARQVRLMAPPKLMKDTHLKLKVAASLAGVTPRCDPESSSLSKEERRPNWRRNVIFDVIGWRMAERPEVPQMLPGDLLDVAYCLDYNDHPEFGGIQLTLQDFRSYAPQRAVAQAVGAAEPPSSVP